LNKAPIIPAAMTKQEAIKALNAIIKSGLKANKDLIDALNNRIGNVAK
jgi:ribosomal protein L7/L12